VIPATGLSLHKPSLLWPPPPNDIRNRVHSGLRQNISDALHRRSKSGSSRIPQAARPIDPGNTIPKMLPTELGPINVGSTASLPLPGDLDADQTISLHTSDGKVIEVTQQVQLYAPNGLLQHPLVSPALSYLGGLPPLMFIAGEREVLRDEIIYTYVFLRISGEWELITLIGPIGLHIQNDFRYAMEQRGFTRPSNWGNATSSQLQYIFRFTMVCFTIQLLPAPPFNPHFLQDVAHVLPILFPFTTPGKYCYRAMALFVKHVTTMPHGPSGPSALSIPSGATQITDLSFAASPSQLTPPNENQSPQLPRPKPRRSLTSGLLRAASHLKRRGSSPAAQKPGGPIATPGERSSASTLGYITPKSRNQSDESVNVAGQRIDGRSKNDPSAVPRAGEARVYAHNWVIFQSSSCSFLSPNTETTTGYYRSSSHDSGTSIDAWRHPSLGARNRVARYESPL